VIGIKFRLRDPLGHHYLTEPWIGADLFASRQITSTLSEIISPGTTDSIIAELQDHGFKKPYP
jgi:hypothetical protein